MPCFSFLNKSWVGKNLGQEVIAKVWGRVWWGLCVVAAAWTKVEWVGGEVRTKRYLGLRHNTGQRQRKESKIKEDPRFFNLTLVDKWDGTYWRFSVLFLELLFHLETIFKFSLSFFWWWSGTFLNLCSKSVVKTAKSVRNNYLFSAYHVPTSSKAEDIIMEKQLFRNIDLPLCILEESSENNLDFFFSIVEFLWWQFLMTSYFLSKIVVLPQTLCQLALRNPQIDCFSNLPVLFLLW